MKMFESKREVKRNLKTQIENNKLLNERLQQLRRENAELQRRLLIGQEEYNILLSKFEEKKCNCKKRTTKKKDDENGR